MKKKRVIALILALIVLTVMLYGCGKSTNTEGQTTTLSASGSSTQSVSETKPEEIKTYTMFVGDTSATPIDLFQTPVGKKIEEITGVNLKFDYITGNDIKVKTGIMIASGDLPDIIAPTSEIVSFIDAGTLVPMDEYIEKYGVNIKKAYGDTLLKRMKYPNDGKIYTVSWQREGADKSRVYPFSGFYLPAGVLKDAGWPKVTKLSQYIDIIKDYIKKNPTYNGKSYIGFTCEMDGWRDYIMTNTPFLLAGLLKVDHILDTKTYECGIMDDSKYNHEYFKMMNDLWNEGLLDREMFSQNYDQYLAKIASGRVIGFYDESWQFETAKANLESQGLYDKVPIPMPVLFDDCKGPDAYNGLITCGSYMSAGVTISKNCKDPEGVFKFIDKMCSDEIVKLRQWGIEGIDYEMQDGKMVRNAEQLKNIQDQQYRDKEGVGSILQAWLLFPIKAPDDLYEDGSGVIDWRHSDQYVQSQYKDYEKEILKAYNITNFNDLFAPFYKSDFGYGYDIQPTDSDKEIQDINNKVSDLRDKYNAKLVMAKKGQFETVWNQFVKEFKKCNPEKELEWYHEHLLQRLEDWK